MPEPLLLVVGSGVRRYREYLLAGASSRYPLWLLDRNMPSWQTRYLLGATAVDVTRPDDLVAAAREVAATHPVAGVFSYDEALILPTAHVSEALGLPGPGVAAVQRCRDKAATRAALELADIPQPASVAVADVDAAGMAAAAIGFPVVLKPRGLGASQGVVRVDHPGALREAWQAAAGAFYPGVPTFAASVLVEEYLDGEEVSIDAAVLADDLVPLTVARKRLGPTPFFDEVGHIVSSDDPLLTDPGIRTLLGDAHRALDLRHIMTHTEIRFTSRGPRIIEINGRLGGDLIPFLGQLASGIDHGALAARVAAGERVERQATLQQSAGIRFACPSADVRIRQIRLPEPPAGGTVRLVALESLAQAGDILRVPPHGYANRYALAIGTGPSSELVEQVLESVIAAAELSADPAPPPGATPMVLVP